MDTEQKNGFVTTEAQSAQHPITSNNTDAAGLFMTMWGAKIKDFGSLLDILDTINGDGNSISDATTLSSGLDEWFNAFICSEHFAHLSADQKAITIKAKQSIMYLLGGIEAFMANNRLGAYAD